MIILGTLSCLGYGPLSFVKIIGMQFLDFFDFLTNSVMMPIAALMTSLFVSKVVSVDRMEEEIRHGESKFRRKKIFVVMIKYLCPIFAIIILVSSVANAFGWISGVTRHVNAQCADRTGIHHQPHGRGFPLLSSTSNSAMAAILFPS